MRRDVLDLREFYAEPLGAAAREMVSRKVAEAWGGLLGALDVLALGYATPYPGACLGAGARRAVAAMPAAQGVEVWPARRSERCACLVDEAALPFPNALFDRILVVHALEESRRARWQLHARGLAGAGAVGPGDLSSPPATALWANAESTPVRPRRAVHARPAGGPWSARPSSSRSAGRGRCYAPPLEWAARLGRGPSNRPARGSGPPFSGLILMEAVRSRPSP